jgi:D-alanine--poly(phosphoribitol) ligase subunit 2
MLETEKVLEVLKDVTEIDEVRKNPDLRWYDVGIVDSLRTIEIIVALEEKFPPLAISPAEIDRDLWATPQHVVQYVMQRIGRA